jgi:hypothetical protein
VEGINRAWVWGVNNIEEGLYGIGRGSIDLDHGMDRWKELRNLMINFRVFMNGEFC